jgi:GTP-binding protein
LKVLSAEFVTSAASRGADDIPADGVAQIAFAGRSNVGKSTLLNALARRTLARTSAAPGKTRLANIYRLQVEGGPGGTGRWSVYFIDLPGYGYARGGADSAAELAAVARTYYESGSGTRDAPASAGTQFDAGYGGVPPKPHRGEGGQRATLLLIDARHPGLTSDLQAHRWLTAVGGAPHIVATKVDKLSRSERGRNLKELEHVFGSTPLPVSAAGGEGLDELWRLIARVVRQGRP